MKRSPLKRLTPLKTRTGLSRARFLNRNPMARKRPQVTSEERKARKLLRARSGGECELHGGHSATEAHHRQNRSQGGQWDVANLMHLCHDAHVFVTVNPQAAREQGWAVPSHRDPAQVPVWLAGRGYVLLTEHGDIEELHDEEVA